MSQFYLTEKIVIKIFLTLTFFQMSLSKFSLKCKSKHDLETLHRAFNAVQHGMSIQVVQEAFQLPKSMIQNMLE